MAESTGKGKGKLIGLIVAAVVVVGALVVCFVIKPSFLPWVDGEDAADTAAPATGETPPLGASLAAAPDAGATEPLPPVDATMPDVSIDDTTPLLGAAAPPGEPQVPGELVRLGKRHPGREFIPVAAGPDGSDWSSVRYIVDDAGGMYVRSSVGFLFEVDDGNIVSDPF